MFVSWLRWWVLGGVLVLSLAIQRAQPVWAAATVSSASAEQLAELSSESNEPIRVSMEFQDVSLKEILKAFSLQTGLNIIAAGDIGEEPMTLYLEDVTVLDALDQILRAGNLVYAHDEGSDIFVVKEKPETEALITRVYRLKYARVSKSVLTKSIAAFGAVTPFEAARTTAAVTGGAAPSGSAGGGDESAVGVDSIIKKLLTDVGTVVVDERTNALIVTDVPENFSRIEAAIVALDAKMSQILVDVELIETVVGKIKDIGIEWGTGAEGTMATLTPGRRVTRSPFSWIGHGDAPTLAPFTDENDVLWPQNLSASLLDASSAQAVLQALETDSQTKVLARPKVLTMDNESAIVRLSTNQAVGFETTTDASTGTVTSEAQRETTGIILSVTPQVNADGYITMLVEPSITKVVTASVTPPDDSTVVDPKTRSTRTLVRIKDGNTLVIGGLIDRTDEHSVSRVPILGRIPLIGKAFENTETNSNTTELIVFVTPTLMKEGDDVLHGVSASMQNPAIAASVTAPNAPAVAASNQERQAFIKQTMDQFERKAEPRTSD